MGAQHSAKWWLCLAISLATQAALYFLLLLYLSHFCPVSPPRPQALWGQGKMLAGSILGPGEPGQCWAGHGGSETSTDC